MADKGDLEGKVADYLAKLKSGQAEASVKEAPMPQIPVSQTAEGMPCIAKEVRELIDVFFQNIPTCS